ncbi:hypothetical protein [Rhodoflexus caldus]|uniref:hypothetical protein n=1 Tax=Rhodoflexus caldus TaxID=2891236 RepID=UPI00202ABAC4|nr:hypothetical protein [Rhodoflexus caldus]
MFKIPTLTRLPQHKRFNYEPRHYDPEMEEIRQRIAEAKARVKADREDENYSSQHALRGAIRRHSRLKRKGADFSQLIFIIGFACIAYAYFTYGSIALLLFFVLVFGYIWYKIRR